MPEINENEIFIRISKPLYERIGRRLSDSNFDSVENYVNYVLDQVLKEVEREEEVNEQDQKIIEERLRALGYL